MRFEEWKGFNKGRWEKEIDVRNFIQLNYKQYNGDESFLKKSTAKTEKIWTKCKKLLKLK